MSLFTEVMNNPLDPAYRAAAERRARTGSPPRHGGIGTVAVVLLALVLGLAVTWSVLELRAPEPGAQAAREVLIEQITERSAELEALTGRSAELSTQIAALQAEALAGQDDGLLAQLDADQITAGTVAVAGQGLRVTLTDADQSEPNVDPSSRVRDSDLQTVVNGLWAAGAEAVAVNGQRLSSTTAIRTAGDAILVDVVPLVSPYTVEAIGDPQDMQVALARSRAGQLLSVLQTTYGIRTQVSAQTDLALPAASTVTLRSARLPEGVAVLEQSADGSTLIPGTGVPGDEGSAQ